MFIMSRMMVNDVAPDFVLNDFDDNEISLADYRTRKNVRLVFNQKGT